MRKKITKLLKIINLDLKSLIKTSNSMMKIIHFPIVDDFNIVKNNNQWLISLDKPAKFRVSISNNQMNKPSNKHMDIYISGKMVCTVNVNNNFDLISYNTSIAYYKCTAKFSSKYEVCDGYHFDMDEVIGFGHPVLHAQRKPSLLYDKIKKYYTNIDLNAENDNAAERNRNFRLPTPQLDFFSALLTIIANHAMTKDQEDHYIKIMDEIIKKNPLRLNFTNQGRLQNCVVNEEITANHWYDVSEGIITQK